MTNLKINIESIRPRRQRSREIDVTLRRYYQNERSRIFSASRERIKKDDDITTFTTTTTADTISTHSLILILTRMHLVLFVYITHHFSFAVFVMAAIDPFLLPSRDVVETFSR